jgi:hypothetical protein
MKSQYALQYPGACSKFYFAGSQKSRKSGFLRSIDRKNPHFEQALSDKMSISGYTCSHIIRRQIESKIPEATGG